MSCLFRLDVAFHGRHVMWRRVDCNRGSRDVPALDGQQSARLQAWSCVGSRTCCVRSGVRVCRSRDAPPASARIGAVSRESRRRDAQMVARMSGDLGRTASDTRHDLRDTRGRARDPDGISQDVAHHLRSGRRTRAKPG